MLTHYHQFRPILPIRTLYRRLLTLYMAYFFLYPRDLNIIKYNELRSLTFMMSTKSINFMTLPLPPSAKMNNRSKSIYCLKTIESTDTYILLRPLTSIPCGRHKFKVAYRIFHSSCDPSEKNSQLRHWL